MTFSIGHVQAHTCIASYSYTTCSYKVLIPNSAGCVILYIAIYTVKIMCTYHTNGVLYDTVGVLIPPIKVQLTLLSVKCYTTFYSVSCRDAKREGKGGTQPWAPGFRGLLQISISNDLSVV